MTPPTRDIRPLISPDDEALLVRASRDMYRCMLERDITVLRTLLADQYTLTHLTGFRQTRSEWLEQISSGAMTYQSAQEQSLAVQIKDHSTPVVVAQNIVDATIWGTRRTWRLQLTSRYERADRGWTAQSTVATTY